MPIINNVDSNITRNLSKAEKDLGVDLKLNADGDLELSNLKDLKLIAGGANAAQAVKLKLEIEPGSLLYHPEIGTNLQIGEKTISAFALKAQIIRSLSRDERFSNVNVNVQVLGSTILVDLFVTIQTANATIPLQFVVER